MREKFRFGSVIITAAVVLSTVNSRPSLAATTKRVSTNCCELRIPSAMKYKIDGNSLTSVGGTMFLSVDSIEASSAIEAAIVIHEMLSVDRVTYEQSTSMWAVETGYLESGDIFYIRAEYDRGCEEAGYMVLWYPKAKKKAFYDLVTTKSKSFRADLC